MYRRSEYDSIINELNEMSYYISDIQSAVSSLEYRLDDMKEMLEELFDNLDQKEEDND